jgi:hypothetical protein
MARRGRSTKVAAASKQSTTILSTFSRVSKRAAAVSKLSVGKENLEHLEHLVEQKLQAVAVEIVLPPKPAVTAQNTKKRKVAEHDDVSDVDLPSPIAKRIIKRPRVTSEQAGALLERLSLSSSPADSAEALPRELTDLLGLHATLLKTLSIHYAHNGTASPVDVRAVCPAASLTWGKRQVTLADLQLCIGIEDMHDDKSPFYLLDYGLGKVCIELRQPGGATPFDEPALNACFESSLRGAWAARPPATTQAFLARLPRAPATKCESLQKARPLLAKGHRALQELKSAAAARKEDAKTAGTETTAARNADGSKPSLLDRIRAKQLAASEAAVARLTPAQLARRAAAQRAPDVAEVVGMLARSSAGGAGGRVSFTMAAVLKQLAGSLRAAVSREEGAAAVRVLGEACPAWLRVVSVAGREHVVCEMGSGAPSRAEVLEALKAVEI